MIPVSRPDLNVDDVRAVAEAVEAGDVAGGAQGSAFEAGVAAACKRAYGIGCTNGTAAMALALQALDVPRGAPVLVPAFTIVSALYAIHSAGHVPLIVDVDPVTWNVDLPGIERGIEHGAAAALLVETYCGAPPMARASELLASAGIPMLEDAAEGFGGAQGERPFGSFGEISTVSFYANKLVTTGEGGMVLTDSPEFAARVRSLRNLAFGPERNFVHTALAGNFRLSNLQAALGLSQLRRMEAFRAHRRRLYERYLDRLGDLVPLIQFQKISLDVHSSYWVFPVVVAEESGWVAAGLITHLREAGVEARHFFHPLDSQPFLSENIAEPCPVSLRLWRQGLYLPMGNGITEEEVEVSANALRQVLRDARRGT